MQASKYLATVFFTVKRHLIAAFDELHLSVLSN